MCNIVGHEGLRYYFTPSEMVKEIVISNISKNEEQLELSYFPGGDIKLYYGEEFSKVFLTALLRFVMFL